MQATLRVGRTAGRRRTTSRPRTAAPGRPVPPQPARDHHAGYLGDFTGTARIEYTPSADGDADPGEVVWAWVPYEEDHDRGKDRPALVIGRDGDYLLALMLSSVDHDRDAADEARWGRHWLDIGSGGWDRQGRPSEARLDRVLRLDPATVRREGAQLDADRFDEVATALRELHGWP